MVIHINAEYFYGLRKYLIRIDNNLFGEPIWPEIFHNDLKRNSMPNPKKDANFDVWTLNMKTKNARHSRWKCAEVKKRDGKRLLAASLTVQRKKQQKSAR